MTDQHFWIDNPSCLLTDLNPFPNARMSSNEKFNSLTRLALIVAMVMFYVDYKYWLQFLLMSLLLIVVLKYSTDRSAEFFSVPPTYIDGAHPMTTVPPLYSEEWGTPTPIYDDYALIPNEIVNMGEQYPSAFHGQYITPSSMLPFQEDMVNNRPLQDVKPFMGDEFTRSQLEFRNSMIRPFINKINREYRHGCFDQISPLGS